MQALCMLIIPPLNLTYYFILQTVNVRYRSNVRVIQRMPCVPCVAKADVGFIILLILSILVQTVHTSAISFNSPL